MPVEGRIVEPRIQCPVPWHPPPRSKPYCASSKTRKRLPDAAYRWPGPVALRRRTTSRTWTRRCAPPATRCGRGAPPPSSSPAPAVRRPQRRASGASASGAACATRSRRAPSARPSIGGDRSRPPWPSKKPPSPPTVPRAANGCRSRSCARGPMPTGAASARGKRRLRSTSRRRPRPSVEQRRLHFGDPAAGEAQRSVGGEVAGVVPVAPAEPALFGLDPRRSRPARARGQVGVDAGAELPEIDPHPGAVRERLRNLQLLDDRGRPARVLLRRLAVVAVEELAALGEG